MWKFMTELGLSNSDRTKLKAIKNQWTRKGNDITDCCNKARSAYLRGEYIDDIAEGLKATRDTVRKHVSGRCNCDVNAPVPIDYHKRQDETAVLGCQECAATFHKYDDLTDHINVVHNSD
jgi:hypothetical protein